MQQKSSILKIFLVDLLFGPAIPDKIDLPESLKIDPELNFLAVESDNQLVDSLAIKIMKKKSSEDSEFQQCKIRSSTIKLDAHLSNPLILQILKGVKISSALRESVVIRALVNTVFEKSYLYFFIYSSLNIMAVILFTLSSIWELLNFYIVIPLFLLCILLLLYEFIVFSQGVWRYVSDIWNWIDLLIYPCMSFFTVYHLIFGYEYQKEWYYNSILFSALFIIYVRSITMLKAIKGARYLIAMILKVFSDTKMFLGVLLVFIIMSTNLESLTQKVNDGFEFDKSLLAWFKLIDGQYNYGYGNWDGSADFQFLLYILYLFSGIFTGLILFNILIAIVSKTFDDFTERQGAINLEEQIDMLLDLGVFMNIFICSKKRKVQREGEGEGHYLHVAEIATQKNIKRLIIDVEDVSYFFWVLILIFRI